MAEYTPNYNANGPWLIWLKMIFVFVVIGLIGLSLLLFCGALFNLLIYFSNQDQTALSTGILAGIISVPVLIAGLVSAAILRRKPQPKAAPSRLVQQEITVAGKEMSAPSYTTYHTAVVTLTQSAKNVNSVWYWMSDNQGSKYRIDREMYRTLMIGDQVQIEYYEQGGVRYVSKLVNNNQHVPIAEAELIQQEKAAINAAFQRGADKKLLVIVGLFVLLMAFTIGGGFLLIFLRMLTSSSGF